jgi:hypothetical protein
VVIRLPDVAAMMQQTLRKRNSTCPRDSPRPRKARTDTRRAGENVPQVGIIEARTRTAGPKPA